MVSLDLMVNQELQDQMVYQDQMEHRDQMVLRDHPDKTEIKVLLVRQVSQDQEGTQVPLVEKDQQEIRVI